MKIERYQAYKDSGIEWIGEVPHQWKITHIKRICKKVTDGAHTSPDTSSEDYPFLTVVNLKNGSLDFENCLYTSNLDYQKLVRNGCNPKLFDVLYSKDGTISESVAIYEEKDFVVGSSFIILRPNKKDINSKYFSYLLTSSIMRFQASIYIKGATLPRISIFNVAKLFCMVPSLTEQKTIAQYLDTKTGQIDRKIDLLTQKAALYGDLKQSLINETVTRGLDKSVPVKDSGIEWIGEVPEHWVIKRIKDLSFLQSGDNIVSEQIEDTGQYPVYGGNGLRGYCSQYTNDGDHILIGRQGALCGNINYASGKFWASEHAVVAYLKPFVHIKWYGEILRIMNLNQYSLSAAQPGLAVDRVKRLLLPVPPLTEQKAIADYLDTKTAQIDQIIQTINTQIEKLKELRKTLINDVVTGKIKVV
ncbi:restriction endonuclease subunit S [Microcoleus sp. FACHB-68]|uniref:restriction endonuclease subunit S n=1 Tax=Microcoleus sp. FACHB-68 TaxID=2692826 RepID=UPI001689D719|nr:restriction endonuclease subunit S [Microcoleus sp. FACHB-68]MBD1937610.1 restriction endonuclease subunit S [Microcoleus sp. FACHB-68]